MSIKKELVNGVIWSAVEKYSGLIVSTVVSMILARILSPDEFGIVAIATVIIHFLQIFCTMGIGPAVIQFDDLSDANLNTIYSFSILLGAIFSCFFFASSWLIADYYDNNQLAIVCQILCVQLFFTSANMVPNALLAKNKRFKDIARRTLFLQGFSGIMSIIAAFKGMGIYALLISPVFSSVGIFFWNRFYYKLSFVKIISFAPIKRIFSFSAYQFLFEFSNYFSRNLDKLIIGRYMSFSDLGVYEKSYRLMQLPMNNITSVINPVLQPVLNELQDNKQEIAFKYNMIIGFVAALSFPIGVFLYMSSSEIIYMFYGSNWNSAVPVFSILSLSVPLQMILSTSGPIFMVCNNTKAQFWIGIRNTITTVIGFLIAAFIFKNIESMAWAWLITLFINFFCTFYIMYKWILRSSFSSMLRKLLMPLLMAIILYVELIIIVSLLEDANFVLSFALKLMISVVTMLPFLRFLNITKNKN